jgi:hypothetical protein
MKWQTCVDLLVNWQRASRRQCPCCSMVAVAPYERCHNCDEKREHRPMHNGSQATLELGPLVWETISCSGGSAPVSLGGSAPEPKTVRWYRAWILRLAGAGRNHHTALQDEKSTWFPCMTHTLAAGINAAVKLPMPLGCAPGAPLNLHQLEFPASKLVDLLHLTQVHGSRLNSQRLSCAQKHFCHNMYVDVSCGCCVMAHAVCHVSCHGRAMVSCRQCAPMQAKSGECWWPIWHMPKAVLRLCCGSSLPVGASCLGSCVDWHIMKATS